jgi:hypothetical protein
MRPGECVGTVDDWYTQWNDVYPSYRPVMKQMSSGLERRSKQSQAWILLTLL